MKRMIGIFLVVVFLSMHASPVMADTQSDMMALLQSMKEQMTQMQKTIDQQNLRIQQLESRQATPAAVSPQAETTGSVSVQPALTENDWQKEIKDNIGEAIPWLKGTKMGGDLRLRYESSNYDDDNDDENTSSDRTRNRFRFRLRWGVEKELAEDWKVGFRLASASTTDPTSTNITLGNPGHFTFKTVLIDRAYALYSPSSLKDYGPLQGVTVGAGKFENPFLRYATTIMWDSDVTPEGLYEKASFKLLGDETHKLYLHTVLGQFVANENSGLETDADVYGYQGALSWSTLALGKDQPVDLTMAASWYEFNNWSQTITTNTAGTSMLRTNTIVADNFRILDLYPEVQFGIHGTPITLWYNYAKNYGNVGTEDVIRSGGNDIHDADTAWGAGLKIGSAKKKGQWETFYGYYEIEANAVVAAFNDADFGGPSGVGSTNRQGHKFGVSYMLTDAVQVNWTGYVVEPLNPGTVVTSSINETVFKNQLDLSYKF